MKLRSKDKLFVIGLIWKFIHTLYSIRSRKYSPFWLLWSLWASGTPFSPNFSIFSWFPSMTMFIGFPVASVSVVTLWWLGLNCSYGIDTPVFVLLGVMIYYGFLIRLWLFEVLGGIGMLSPLTRLTLATSIPSKSWFSSPAFDFFFDKLFWMSFLRICY